MIQVSTILQDITQLNTALNEKIQRFNRWLQGNKVSLTVAITRSMLITTKQMKHFTASSHVLQPSIREEQMEVICDTKYLGVQTDENLTWMN